METTVTSTTDPRTRWLWLALVAALVLAAGAGTWTVFSARRAAPADTAEHAGGLVPPDAGEALPAFSLTDRSGRTVTLDDLMGKVWIADFIFTRCPNVCPDLTRKMRDVRKKLDEAGGGEIVSVSITVDPKHDTPKILADYAESFRAEPSWLFLTGEPREVYGLVTSGFHLAMADPDEAVPGHSNRFVLVDARGRVRGTRLGTEDGVVDAIVKDALALEREPSRSARR
jgi:protein SCO1/2